jgi:hypothetical protein
VTGASAMTTPNVLRHVIDELSGPGEESAVLATA